MLQLPGWLITAALLVLPQSVTAELIRNLKVRFRCASLDFDVQAILSKEPRTFQRELCRIDQLDLKHRLVN